ncbi:hypothetical protein F7725_005930 [Dissostichus mawsoni]|uniref:Uncharacterized protein n=1 Tax=Dissostichus mawsoni TaxID=36200 RepID=A0A7J5YSY2_DISMA|nr:hypothetical protein F7725_005930 [Dissostichus mawsoni]
MPPQVVSFNSSQLFIRLISARETYAKRIDGQIEINNEKKMGANDGDRWLSEGSLAAGTVPKWELVTYSVPQIMKDSPALRLGNPVSQLWRTSREVKTHLYVLCVSGLYHDVPSVGDGGVDGPQPHLVGHEVDVGGPPPAVGEGVVVSRSTQAALEQHTAGAEMSSIRRVVSVCRSNLYCSTTERRGRSWDIWPFNSCGCIKDSKKNNVSPGNYQRGERRHSQEPQTYVCKRPSTPLSSGSESRTYCRSLDVRRSTTSMD